MRRHLAFASVLGLVATAASAHPGAHVHPHDGAHWLVLVGALFAMTLAGGLAAARLRSRK